MKSRTYLVAFIAIVVAASALAPMHALAGKHEGKTVTVVGTLIDTKCYGMNHANTGTDHMTPRGTMPNCAQACARQGIPVGLLENGKRDGKVYLLVTPSVALADHMARTVKITGKQPFEGSILPEKIWVRGDDGKWEELKIATMM